MRGWRFSLFGKFDDKTLRKDLNLRVMERLDALEADNASLKGDLESALLHISDLETRVTELES